jgi:DNA mismatch endonuclease (patch repair protein)
MMDGCYWHGCPVHGRIPKSNVAFWTGKIARNVARDAKVDAELRALGWVVWRVWEHDLRPARVSRTRKNLRRRLARLVSSSRSG